MRKVGAELLGVASAGVLVGAVGVRWSILGLGTGVVLAAAALSVADRRDRADEPVAPAPRAAHSPMERRPA